MYNYPFAPSQLVDPRQRNPITNPFDPTSRDLKTYDKGYQSMQPSEHPFQSIPGGQMHWTRDERGVPVQAPGPFVDWNYWKNWKAFN